MACAVINLAAHPALLIVLGLVVVWETCHWLISIVLGVPGVYWSLDTLILDRRSSRIVHGRRDIGWLDEIADVRVDFVCDECERFDDSRHVISLDFVGEGREPIFLWAFWDRAEATAFARRVAGFVGVPVVESKKPETPGDLVALADDSLAGDSAWCGG